MSNSLYIPKDRLKYYAHLIFELDNSPVPDRVIDFLEGMINRLNDKNMTITYQQAKYLDDLKRKYLP